MDSGYTEDETTLDIQQTTTKFNNKILTRITSLTLTSDNLTSISGVLALDSLTLNIKNELAKNFKLSSFVSENELRALNLTDSNFTKIPDSFAKDFKRLRNVKLPKNTITIGSNTFWGTDLRRIELPDTVETVYSYAFYNCKSLYHIKWSHNLKKIGMEAFRNIGINVVGSQLDFDLLNTSLTSLSQLSFESKKIGRIYIPSTVTQIDSPAFSENTTVYYKGTATGAPWGAKEVITEF